MFSWQTFGSRHENWLKISQGARDPVAFQADHLETEEASDQGWEILKSTTWKLMEPAMKINGWLFRLDG